MVHCIVLGRVSEGETVRAQDGISYANNHAVGIKFYFQIRIGKYFRAILVCNKILLTYNWSCGVCCKTHCYCNDGYYMMEWGRDHRHGMTHVQLSAKPCLFHPLEFPSLISQSPCQATAQCAQWAWLHGLQGWVKGMRLRNCFKAVEGKISTEYIIVVTIIL